MNLKPLLFSILCWALVNPTLLSSPQEDFVPQVVEVAQGIADPEYVSGTFDLPIPCEACVGFAAYLRYNDAGRPCAPEPGLWGVFVSPINAQGNIVTRFERCIGKSAAMGGNPFNVLTNGPEWVVANGSPEVYFTGARDNDPIAADYEIRRSYRGKTGLTTTTLDCPGSVHTPMGSLATNTVPPFIVFASGAKGDMHQSVHTLDVGEPCSTGMIDVLPTVTDSRPNPQRRVVEGQRTLGTPDLVLPAFQETTTAPFGRVQIVGYDIDVPGPVYDQQLTADDYQKRTVFAWQDPEVAADFVFFAVEAPPETEKYRMGTCDDGSGEGQGRLFDRCHQWNQLGLYTFADGIATKVGAIKAPSGPAGQGYTVFFSTEPFVFEGRSYLSTELRNPWKETQLWLLGLDFTTGTTTLERRVDEGRGGQDPEPFVRSDTVHIYFTSRNGEVTLRATTGL